MTAPRSDGGSRAAREALPLPAGRGALSLPAFRARLALLVLLVAGGGAPSPSDAAIRPRYGGTLTRGFVGEVGSLNPLGAASPIGREVGRQLHAGLYRFGRDGEPEMDLAERVEPVPGRRAVLIRLRAATFHDGQPVLAEDARRALERFAGSATAGALLAAPALGVPPGESLARVVGARDLVLHIDAAPGLWRWLLADPRAAVLPPEGDGVIGAGPFRSAPVRDGEALRLEAYAGSYEGRPLFDAIVYRRFDDRRALMLGHRFQGVDVIDLTDTIERPGTEVGSMTETVMLQLNPRVFTSPSQRRLVARAVRREALVDVVLGGRGTVTETLLMPRPVLASQPQPEPDPDPSRPRPGLPTDAVLLYPIGSDLGSVAERLRVDLGAVGMRIRARPVTWTELVQAMADGRGELALTVSWSGGQPAACELADVSGRLGIELPQPLRAAVRVEDGLVGDRLLRAERELLDLGLGHVLFRRERTLLARTTVVGVTLDASDAILYADAWRWPPP